MVCFLDMDGVLADFVRGMCNAHMCKNPFDDPRNYGKWNLAPMLGLTSVEFWYKATVNFWKNLPWTDDGKEIYDTCLKVFDRVIICTHAHNGEAMAGKYAWMQKHIPNVPFIFIKDKYYLNKEGHVLIDDADHNIEHWPRNGFLVPRPWNKAYNKQGHVPTMIKEKYNNVR